MATVDCMYKMYVHNKFKSGIEATALRRQTLLKATWKDRNS